MKKFLKMTDLDCAHCAAKMEANISKLNGVNSVVINFMAQKMAIDIDDDKFDTVILDVIKECKKVEPDCNIVL